MLASGLSFDLYATSFVLTVLCSLSTDGASELSSRTTNQAQIDAEDGEIDDAKMIDAPLIIEAVDQKDIVPPLGQPTKNLQTDATQQTHLQLAEKSSKVASRPQTPQPVGSKPEVVSVAPTAAPSNPTPIIDPKPVTDTNLARTPLMPPGPETSRHNSANAINGRLPHTLPSRPEPPYSRGADSRTSDRATDRGLRDHSRDTRPPDRNGIDRSRDSIHERPTERHVHGTQPRSHELSTERSYNLERNRTSSGWGVEYPSGRLPADDRHTSLNHLESRPPIRDERKEWSHRERSFGELNNNSRAPEIQAPPLRDQAMAPPRSSIPQHPDRAALIHGGQDREKSLSSSHLDRRRESNRYERQANSDRSSRGPSPSRLDDRHAARHDFRHDDRQPNDVPQTPTDFSHGHAARYDDNRVPTGPRGGGQGVHDRFQESPRHAPTIAPANEPNRRPTQESNYSGRQQESQYGRLNQGPELSAGRANTGSDVPSGPRLPNGNNAAVIRPNGRNVSGSYSNSSTPHSSTTPSNAMAIQDRQTPKGPASRGPPRNSLPMPRLDTSQPAPATQATESPDTAGVHPDRLRAIQGAVKPAQGNTLPSPSASSIGRPPRPPLPPVSDPSSAANRPPHGQLPSPGGINASPVGPMTATMGPSPTGRGPPAGPSVHDRSRGDRRMLAGLQSVLQQAGTPNVPERSSQGASIRGRGGRANSVLMHSALTSGPPASSMQRPEQGRGDLPANRNSGPSAPVPGEIDGSYGRGTRRGPPRDFPREPNRDGERDMARDSERERELMRDEAREGERRSGRLRSSRDDGRDVTHGSTMLLRDEDRPPRREDGRDRGNDRQPMPPPTERDMRHPSRGDEQRRMESDRREMEGWGPERRGGMDRRDDRDRREGGGSGRKRVRTADDGRVQDDKRQRRFN